jgi:hypothetical protein
MRFFFSASVHGKKTIEANYRLIEQEVKRLGHDVDSSTVLDQDPTPL